MKKTEKRVLAVLLSLIMVFSLLPLSVFAADDHEHVDENVDGYCDECWTVLASSVTVYTTKAVTKFFKVGTLIYEDNIRSLALSQGVEIAGLFYGDGTPVKDTDIVPYGVDTMEIYTVVFFDAEGPTCDHYGHKAYYLNGFDDTYYEDENCTKRIGDEDDLRKWSSSFNLGATEKPLGHIWSCTENINLGHICAREECEYHEKPGMHTLGDDDAHCAECGAPCYVGCEHEAGYSDYYAFANDFVNDGEPLEYVWYYVGESVTLTEPLIIAGRDVRLLIADGVTFDAQAGYHCLTDCAFDVYYQSRGDNRGNFIGTEYKCFDEASGEYYPEHINGDGDLYCDVCEKSICTHKDITETFDWSDDYSSCYGKVVCDTCDKVLVEGDGEIEVYEISKGDCETKGKIRYAAYFDFGWSKKDVETEYGPHEFDDNFYCRNCFREDLLGAKSYYSKCIDRLFELTDDEDLQTIFGKMREEINAAEHVGMISDVFDEYRDQLEDLYLILEFENYRESRKEDLKNYAKSDSFHNAALTYVSEIEYLFDGAGDYDAVDEVYYDACDYIYSINRLKSRYIGEIVELYDSASEIGKAVILQIYDEICAAVHTGDVEEIYSGAYERITLAEIEPAKTAAKAAIDEKAGNNQSAEMQTVVAGAKAAIDNAKNADAVETAKQNGLAAIQKQFDKEAAAKALAEAKTAAKAAIDAAAGSNQSAAMQTIVSEAKNLIDRALNILTVESAKETGLANIQKQFDKEAAAKALAEAKTAAKEAVDGAAGSNQSAAMQSIVAETKSSIDNAKTIAEVEAVKQAGLAKIEAQKQAEKPTDDVCPNCGHSHSNDFFGQILCFIYRIINWFTSIFG